MITVKLKKSVDYFPIQKVLPPDSSEFAGNW
jgi:hypothetical protein